MTTSDPIPDDLRPFLDYLMAEDGRLWLVHRGKPHGEPLAFVSLAVARQAAKVDPGRRNAIRTDDGRVQHGPPPHLVFDAGGRRWVHAAQGLDPAAPGDGGRSSLVPEPIPLRGDERTGWVKLSRKGAGTLVVHAPSVAAELFARTR